MVDDLDLDDLARLDQALGGSDVTVAGSRVAGGMIVCKDHRCAIAL